MLKWMRLVDVALVSVLTLAIKLMINSELAISVLLLVH